MYSVAIIYLATPKRVAKYLLSPSFASRMIGQFSHGHGTSTGSASRTRSSTGIPPESEIARPRYENTTHDRGPGSNPRTPAIDSTPLAATRHRKDERVTHPEPIDTPGERAYALQE